MLKHTVKSLPERGERTDSLSVLIADVGDELRGFGVWIVQIALPEIRDSVQTPRLTLERLMNESMLSQFVSQSSRDVPSGRRIVPMRQPQIQMDDFWRKGETRLQQVQNVAIGPRHPLHHRRH